MVVTDLVIHFRTFQTGMQLLEQLKIMSIVLKVEGEDLKLNSLMITFIN